MSRITRADIEELASIIRRAGGRITLDRWRNITHPCWWCGDTSAEWRVLLQVATACTDQPGNIRRGDEVERPLCAWCAADLARMSNGGDK